MESRRKGSMSNSNIRYADKKILPAFEAKALTIIKNEKMYFDAYLKKEDEIDELFNDKEFQKDLDIFKSLIKKYINKYNIDLPVVLGYKEETEIMGYFELDGKIYILCEELFDTEEGIKVIEEILDFFEIDYKCKGCIVRPTCKVLEHFDDCEGPDELHNNPFIYNLLAKIIGFLGSYK